MEVMTALSELLGVESRILSVGEGARVGEQLPLLKDHFRRQGTPVMIGGGVLAYTLVGVEEGEDGEPRFLIVDPHYEGGDRNVKEVCGKGWVAWQKKGLFKKGVFYNFCLPQLPK